MSDDDPSGAPPPPTSTAEPVHAEPFEPADDDRLRHLSEHRTLIVRRALLATALGGALPVPVLDDYFAARVRAGMFMKLAELRGVGLPAASAELLAEARGSSTARNVTLTAATLLALKLAWRKLLTLLAAGRGAEEAAMVYQAGLLFDHYCARVHTGPPLDRDRAARLRRVIHDAIGTTSKDVLVAVFRDGSRILGRSLLQAPGWLNQRLADLSARWVAARGDPDALRGAGLDTEGDGTRWLDRAARAVESRLAALGNDYVTVLLDRFEARWSAVEKDTRSPPSPPPPGN